MPFTFLAFAKDNAQKQSLKNTLPICVIVDEDCTFWVIREDMLDEKELLSVVTKFINGAEVPNEKIEL